MEDAKKPAPSNHVAIAARAFMELFIAENGDERGLTVEDIDHNELANRYDELERAIAAGTLGGKRAMLNGPLEEVAGYIPETFPMSSDYNKFDLIDYALQYGGRCRDCADADGVCPSSGMPCDPTEARKAASHVLKAWQYGTQHGFIDNPFDPPLAENTEGRS